MKDFIVDVADNPTLKAGHIVLTFLASIVGLPLLTWALIQVYTNKNEQLTRLEKGQDRIVELITSNRETTLRNTQKNDEQDRLISRNDSRLTRLENTNFGRN